MSSSQHFIKQIATGRRRPGMTRKEYFDHRFRIHGAISDATEDKNQKPHKYIQTQIFDAAFGPRAGGPLNANQHWCGRDDTTELFFRDWDHVLTNFNCDHVKTKVGPDGPLFADFESSIVLMAREKQVELQTRLASERSGKALSQSNNTVAMYFISTPDDERNGGQLEPQLTPILTRALEQYCQDDACGIIANIGEVSEKLDLNAYFGGADAPKYAIVYKIYLKGPDSVPAVRQSQRTFEAAAKDLIDLHESFIVFSKEAVVMDVGENVRFSLDRQPIFHDLPGPSHLDD